MPTTSALAKAGTVSPIEQQINLLLNKQNYEGAILKLEKIISSNSYTPYQHCQAYIQKAAVYKRLRNYPTAAYNLQEAQLLTNSLSKGQAELRVRILAERLLISLELHHTDEINSLARQLSTLPTDLLDPQSKVYYYTALARIALANKDYTTCDIQVNKAMRSMQVLNPSNLPQLYHVKVSLSMARKEYTQALLDLEKGLANAEKYQIQSYRIMMLEQASSIHEQLGDYKQALSYQNQIKVILKKDSTHIFNGKLHILERQLLKKNVYYELLLERRVKLALLGFAIVLILALLISWKHLKKYRHLKKNIEQEKDSLQLKLTALLSFEDRNMHKPEPVLQQLPKPSLSRRHLEIICLVNQGKTNKEIAQELYISENTVKYHLKSIFELLGVINRTQLTQISRELELVNL